MQRNPIKAALARGELNVGTWINMVRNPAILSLLKSAGLNFARLDMEHSSPSIETVADMAVLARAIDFPLVVRPPKANREWITRLLDAGIWNLHCPRVETVFQAAEIVELSHYAPVGRRGIGGLGPAAEFDPSGSALERSAWANDQIFITIMLETRRAFDCLDEIAAMEGIDALTLGPADLAQDLGVFGTPEQSRVLDERREMVLAAAKRHGKVCSMLVSSPAEARKWRDAGAKLLVYSSDVEILHSGFGQFVANIGREADAK